ncbi:hypothetical protein [Niveispirillum cyanobacteriorum]|uniref:Uncharacterized protein n=1 Tax=Niveispirillum cyanobacteriorum TaxID=1612173 RepID=A0A2K9NDR0_9PROT|nr:hypothetical protein [Niveispirillum cyanobacteriorum]AUN31244.1 hypothetical protein C0V82_14130 [Niveispirillum cyanobacteriorum]GGE72996.1 hypothetical protein GCM10011317_32770 [Niveispirillum cyanobacteriorum]
MATKRGPQDGAKPAEAAQGVAPVPPQGQTQTPPQTPLAGEGLPELTREAYEAIVRANTDFSIQLQEALDDVAALRVKLSKAEEREQQALAVIERLNATNAEQAQALANAAEPEIDLSSTISVADAARFAGVRVNEVLNFKLYEGELVVVTITGQKIRKAF